MDKPNDAVITTPQGRRSRHQGGRKRALSIRMHEDERNLITRIAEASNYDDATWARRVLVEQARAELEALNGGDDSSPQAA